MARKRRFEKGDAASGTYWEIQLMALLQTTWEGKIGQAQPAELTMHKTRAAAEEAYDALIAHRLAKGYREVRKASAPNRKPTKTRAKIPKHWQHPVFGALERPRGLLSLWERPIDIPIFGGAEVRLTVNGEYPDGVSQLQQNAYSRFMPKQKSLFRQAEKALFNYYQSICEDCRSQFGEYADQWAPVVRTMAQFSRIVTPTALYFPSATSRRTVGLLLDCTWDSSHGVAVKYVEERIREVGSQDIVL
jgi:predicted DNA-binding WGR domain protein